MAIVSTCKFPKLHIENSKATAICLWSNVLHACGQHFALENNSSLQVVVCKALNCQRASARSCSFVLLQRIRVCCFSFPGCFWDKHFVSKIWVSFISYKVLLEKILMWGTDAMQEVQAYIPKWDVWNRILQSECSLCTAEDTWLLRCPSSRICQG